ncbi:hypothetical protein ACRQGA_09350, partial [Actinotignum sp. GS-2025b]
MSKRTYTREQIRKALTTYQRTQSVTATVRKLGYPGRDTLYKWIRNSNEKPEQRKPKKHAPNQKISTDVKVTACKRFRSGENAYTIAQDLGIVNCTNIYAWVKKWDAEGSLGLMNEKECDQIKAKTRHQLEAQLPQDPEELRALVADLIVQKRVLKAQLELAKKGKARTGGRSEAVEKTRVANQLRSTTPLAMVLD